MNIEIKMMKDLFIIGSPEIYVIANIFVKIIISPEKEVNFSIICCSK